MAKGKKRRHLINKKENFNKISLFQVACQFLKFLNLADGDDGEKWCVGQRQASPLAKLHGLAMVCANRYVIPAVWRISKSGEAQRGHNWSDKFEAKSKWGPKLCLLVSWSQGSPNGHRHMGSQMIVWCPLRYDKKPELDWSRQMGNYSQFRNPVQYLRASKPASRLAP